MLLTDVAVVEAKDAWQRVDWYEWRWPAMEEFHKGQKTGCDVEGPQFTTKGVMEAMIGVLSVVGWLLMYGSRRGDGGRAGGEGSAGSGCSC